MIYYVESEMFLTMLAARGGSASEKTSKKLDNAGAKREALEWR